MNNEKVTLVICDGMGLSPDARGNAILNAPTPTIDYLLQNYPSTRLLAAGTEVGLDMGEPGNSEVGHVTLGTGQVMPQALQIINAAIKSETYQKNKVFLAAMEAAKQSPTNTLHLVGLISKGGVHGHRDHMIELLKLAKEKGIERVAVHAITDGRDAPPRVALEDSAGITDQLRKFKYGVIATVGGRFYALDRDNHWERTDAFYWSMLGKSALRAPSFEAAVQTSYTRGENDETLKPTVIQDTMGVPLAPVKPGDVVIFTNYRPDRIRQLSTRIIMTRQAMTIVTMTDYFLGDVSGATSSGSTLFNAYPLPKPKGTLAETLSHAHKRQLHIAETEKYAHITYFFNGHEETKWPQEQWLLVPSVRIDSFARVPEMSAAAITSAYLQAKQQQPYDFVTLNFANMDMVGHTGDYNATLQAVTTVDAYLRPIIEHVEQANEWLILTSDHGNAEQMVNPITGEIDKEHTTNPVPFILVNRNLKQARGMDKQQLTVLSNVAMLADVAPTILEIMGVGKTAQMVGASLLKQMIA